MVLSVIQRRNPGRPLEIPVEDKRIGISTFPCNFGNELTRMHNLQPYIDEKNSSPRRYVWKADGHKILEKINPQRGL